MPRIVFLHHLLSIFLCNYVFCFKWIIQQVFSVGNTFSTTNNETNFAMVILLRFNFFFFVYEMCAKSLQSCLTLCYPMDCSPTRLLCPWDSPGKNTGMGGHALLQGIFLTQGSNLHLLHLLHCQVSSLPGSIWNNFCKLKIFLEIIIDPYEVARNNTDRFCVPLTVSPNIL